MWFCIKCCFIRFNLYDLIQLFIFVWFRIKAIAAEEEDDEDDEDYEDDENEEEEDEDEDEEYEDEEEEEEEEEVGEEEEEVGGHAVPPMAAASLIVPVVGNHNQQRNHVNANFEGSSSHLAILYEPLLGTFSKCFRVFIHFHIIQIVLYSFVLYELNVSKSYYHIFAHFINFSMAFFKDSSITPLLIASLITPVNTALDLLYCSLFSKTHAWCMNILYNQSPSGNWEHDDFRIN